MTTYTAERSVTLRSRLQRLWYVYRANRRGAMASASAAADTFRTLVTGIETHLQKDVAGLRVLDLGCGQRATQTALFAARGARVTGIDIEVPTYSMNVETFLRVGRASGWARATSALGRHLLFDRGFFRELRQETGLAISHSDLDILHMSATDLSLPEQSFDFVFSIWVFEHIDNVARVAQEVNRVLVPGGLCWITAHLFPSLSGGHHPEWMTPDTEPARHVPPWDHLRERKHPVGVFLNRLRVAEYRRRLSQHLDVFEEHLETEGGALLTTELERELSERGYSRDDLLTRSATFICRKRL